MARIEPSPVDMHAAMIAMSIHPPRNLEECCGPLTDGAEYTSVDCRKLPPVHGMVRLGARAEAAAAVEVQKVVACVLPCDGNAHDLACTVRRAEGS